MNKEELFLKQAFDERPVAYRPVIAKALGSVKIALFISQLYYWKDKGWKENKGWIYKTRDEIYNETGLSRSEQENARKVAREMGILDEIRKGIPPKIHFRINVSTLSWYIENYYKTGRPTIKSVAGRFVCQSEGRGPIYWTSADQ